MEKKDKNSRGRFRPGRRSLIVAAVAVILYTITGFAIVPAVIKSMLPERLSAALNRPVAVDAVAFNPFSMSIDIRGLDIGDRQDGSFVHVNEIMANAEVIASLAGTATIKHLLIREPSVRVVRNADGTFNFSDLLKPSAGEDTAAEAPASGPPSFLLRRFDMTGGRIAFEDRSGKSVFSTTIAPLDINVRKLGSRPKDNGSYRVHLKTDMNTTVTIEGAVSLAEMKTSGTCALEALPLAPFKPYYEPYLDATIDSGSVRLAFAYALDAANAAVPMPVVEKLSFGLGDFKMRDAGGEPVASVSDISVVADRIDPANGDMSIDQIRIADGHIRTGRHPDGRLEILDLIKSRPAAAAADPPSSGSPPAMPPWQIALNRFSLEKLAVEFVDRAAATPATASVAGIDVSMASLAHRLDGASPLPSLETADIKLSDVRLTPVGGDRPIVAVPVVNIAGIHIDPDNNQVTVDTVGSSSGTLAIDRLADGSINLINAVLPQAPASADAAPTPEPAAAPKAEEKPFPIPTVTVASVNLSDYNLRFTDATTTPAAAVSVSPIRITATGVTTAKDARIPVGVDMAVGKKGRIHVAGDVAIAPVSAKLDLSVKNVDLNTFNPYVTQHVGLLIKNGRFNTSGKAALALAQSGPPDIRYRGQASVNGFHSVDSKRAQDFLNWKSLFLTDMDVALKPMKVHIGQVALTDYFARMMINPDGTMNVKQVLAPAAEEANGGTDETTGGGSEKAAPETSAATESAAPAPDIRIGQVTFQGGRVDFTDNLIDPAFHTEMLDLGGSITGLSSEELARANVFLRGRLEDRSPLEITGKINPLIKDQFSDIDITFSDIELSPFSPYSGKFIGRLLDKGKLSLVLNYRLSENKLVAENKITVDQLTLGDRVESPDATKLPVELAIALLKDRSGKIHLDVPVRGDLDDPQFSLGKVILNVVVNLFTKIITSPLAALGSIFGGGEELSHIDFAPGAVNLDAKARETLDALVTALYERPGLQLEIQGEVEPESDTIGLRDNRYDALIAAEKEKAAITKQPVATDDTGAELPPDAPFIAAAYASADIPKPRNADGSVKKLPVEEMQKLLYTHITVGESDLRRLASDRAEAAMNYIAADGRIAGDRIFLREPKAIKTDAKEDEYHRRVNFSLK